MENDRCTYRYGGSFTENMINKIKKYILTAAAALSVLLAIPIYTFAEGLAVHFIDVGQGDAALIVCDEHAMLIDGGGTDSSRTMYTYLKRYGVSHLDYIIGTHPDADHIGGLPGALNFASADNVFCSVTEHDTRAFNSLVKYAGEQGKQITVPKTGSTYALGDAAVRLIGPINNSSDSNNNSIVARISYGSNTFLFMGDAEAAEENDILHSQYGKLLKSDVLKVGHHGSDTSSTEAFLEAVSPQYAVISVGENNSYGHPSADVVKRLEKLGTKVYRTDTDGDIICESDGTNISFSTAKYRKSDKTTASDENASDAASGSGKESTAQNYILNISSGKFHYPECKSAKRMNESNKKYFYGTREEAIKNGYTPCGNCNP